MLVTSQFRSVAEIGEVERSIIPGIRPESANADCQSGVHRVKWGPQETAQIRPQRCRDLVCDASLFYLHRTTYNIKTQ